MKHNFVLRKDNVGVFKQRFEKLLNITGCLESHGIYKGARKVAGTVAHLKGGNFHLVTQTCSSYILKKKMEYDIYGRKNEGLIVRFHSDACFVLFYGQKIKFTPSRIYLIGEPKEMLSHQKYGLLHIIQPFHNIKEAQYEIAREERYAKEYWDECRRELDREIDKDLVRDFGYGFHDTIDEGDLVSPEETSRWEKENKINLERK